MNKLKSMALAFFLFFFLLLQGNVLRFFPLSCNGLVLFLFALCLSVLLLVPCIPSSTSIALIDGIVSLAVFGIHFVLLKDFLPLRQLVFLGFIQFVSLCAYGCNLRFLMGIHRDPDSPSEP